MSARSARLAVRSGGGPLRPVVSDVDPLAHRCTGRAPFADRSSSRAHWFRRSGAHDRNWADRRHGPARSATLLANDAPGHAHPHAGGRAPGVGIACSIRGDLTGFSGTAALADAGHVHQRCSGYGSSPRTSRTKPQRTGPCCSCRQRCSCRRFLALPVRSTKRPHFRCWARRAWSQVSGSSWRCSAPASWRPMAGGVALGAQFVVLWIIGRGPVIGHDGGTVVPASAALLLGPDHPADGIDARWEPSSAADSCRPSKRRPAVRGRRAPLPGEPAGPRAARENPSARVLKKGWRCLRGHSAEAGSDLPRRLSARRWSWWRPSRRGRASSRSHPGSVARSSGSERPAGG